MKKTFRLILLTPLFLFAACETTAKKPTENLPEDKSASAAPAVSPAPLHAWLEWVGTDTLSARAAVRAKECPALVVTAKTEQRYAMTARSQPTAAFPVLVCEKIMTLPARGPAIRKVEVVSAADGSAAIKMALPVPSRRPTRIVVIGDTGCRLKGPSHGGEGAYQACNDPKSWPLETVSAAAAAFKPDLVIHLGDIHYREASCPVGNKGCEGATGGYDWQPWEADFFTPARTLLQAAPWIIVRGNHEACSRAGEGWAKLLEPGETATCLERTENYVMKFGTHALAVVDSSEEKNLGPGLAKLAADTPKNQKYHRWLLTHRPFLTANTDPKQPSAELIPESLRAPGMISFVMAGHIHTLSLNRFADWRPAEIIAGNSATALDTNIQFLQKRPGDEFFQRETFGFVTLEQKSVSTWALNARDTAGGILQTCVLKESFHHKTSIVCEKK